MNKPQALLPFVYIRTDGNTETGLGHLVRCTALAHMLKDAFRICFVCREIPPAQTKELTTSGFELLLITQEDDFLSRLLPNDFVVLDGYAFTSDYQKSIKATGSKLICIDDLHDREFFADLIINHAPGITPEHYKAQEYTKFALGPDYALLRPEFRMQLLNQRTITKIEKALICFGGGDAQNFTKVALEVLVQFKELKKISVITGSAYSYLNSLLQLLQADNRTVHHHALNANEMATQFLLADVVIVPASGVLIEALACGCVPVTGYLAANQSDFHNAVIAEDGLFSVGVIDADYPAKLASTLRLLMDSQPVTNSKIRSRLGASGNSILQAFKNLSNEGI